MFFGNKKFGFTLSEVMLTMTLIGALAALTIPTIGTSFQQKARLSEFRAAYAKFDTALRNITFEKGAPFYCFDAPTEDEIIDFGLDIDNEHIPSGSTNQCEEFKNLFTRYLGVIRSCESDPIGEGCLPSSYPTFNGDDCFADYSNSHAYVLDNSMFVITAAGNDFGKFAVDINGKKGPNKWGQDIFPLSVKATEAIIVGETSFVKQTGLLPGDNGCTYPESGGVVTSSELMKQSAGML